MPHPFRIFVVDDEPLMLDLLAAILDADHAVEVFASAEAKLKGYEAGGEDFIVKPIDADELLSKVQIAKRIADEQQQLREHARFAERTAMSAMTSMGELGGVIDFLRKTFACATDRELAAELRQLAVQ